LVPPIILPRISNVQSDA